LAGNKNTLAELANAAKAARAYHHPMPNQAKNIAVLISGASVAGLTTAYWLVHYGFKVTVVERAPHLRLGGQALDLRGPALEVAERMGMLASFRERATKLTGMSILDGQGKEISTSTDRTLTGGRLDSPDIEVLRDDLCKVLYEAVKDHVDFLFGDSATSISQDAAGVDVSFAHAAPRRFDLVIGADGLHSGVRRLVFGPDEQFLRFTGMHIAVFSVPNFLGLDHWEVFCHDGETSGLMLATDKNANARVYLGFATAEPLDYDYRDIAAQKRLISEHYKGAGWEFPRILEYMQQASDFYFYSASQVRMDRFSHGRVVLVGDAGYSVTPASGQGTTVAMVGAYVLAGELAAKRSSLRAGIDCYEHELRDYVTRNLDIALDLADFEFREREPGQAEKSDSIKHPDGTPNFDVLVQPIALKNYSEFVP
jgi:2-polyprenyl-6-methoxyphenol hydroxylase-like FAD-dependent oxidoreductase